MKLYIDFEDYEPWAGAKDTYETIVSHDKLEELDCLITSLYPGGLSTTELNDILWFEDTWVLAQLGIEDNDNDDME